MQFLMYLENFLAWFTLKNQVLFEVWSSSGLAVSVTIFNDRKWILQIGTMYFIFICNLAELSRLGKQIS